MIEVKAGYKQTEVGVIPDDWEVVVFENIADKSKKWSITGGPFGSNLKVSDYTNDGVQIIQLQNIGDGNFIDDYQIFTSEEKANELLSCNIYPNEIILSKMGDPVARACFMPIKAKRYLMASDGIRLVVNEKDFSKKFIHDYINSIYFRKRAFEISTGSTRLRIGLPELKSLLVIKPPKSEQSAIATILSDTDALIERLEKLIAKKIAIKQGTMQQLLTGKKRLPGFSGEWEMRKLGEYVIIESGESPSKFKFKNDGIPYYKVDQLNNGNKYQKYTPYFIECNNPIPKGSIIFPKRGASILLNKVRILTEDSFMDTNLMTLTTSDELNNEYLFYMLIHIELWHVADTTSIPQINNKHIKPLEIPIPSFLEQQTIAAILSDMDAEIESLEQKRDKYTMIKQGMMQQLLTGRIRIHGTH